MGYKNEHRVIRFRSRLRRHGEFANDAPWAIRIEDVTWPTVTHYLVAKQYPGLVWTDVRNTRLEDLASLAQGERACQRCKWEIVHDDYLLRALMAKFTQHLDLEEKLYETGQARLVFADRTDSYLGIGPNRTGHNMLGRLLMVARRRIGRPALRPEPPVQDLQALTELEDLARKYPRNADKLSDLAIGYYNVGWYERARATARASLRADATHEYGYYVLASALVRLGRYDEAMAPLKVLIRMDGESAFYFRLLADVCRFRQKKIPAILYERRARLLEDGQQE